MKSIFLGVVAFSVFAVALLGGTASGEVGATCFGRQATIVHRSNEGEVKGTPYADVIVTGSGDDVIHGRGGNDRICSGPGDDHVNGGGGSDSVDARDGMDVLEGENGSDLLVGGKGFDTIRGNRGNDRISGGAGSGDSADGGLGDDLVAGGPGSRDRVIGGVGNDRLRGGPGDEDLLRGDHGADLFDGGEGSHDVASFAVSGFAGPVIGGEGVEVDLATGRASQDGSDRLTRIEDVIGTGFNDHLTGDSAENVLYGGGGNDQLQGVGQGNRLLGGPGSDVCEEFVEAESCGREAEPSKPLVEVAVAGGPSGGSLTVVGRKPGFVPGSLAEPPPEGIAVEVGFESNEWTVDGGPELLAGEGCVAGSASAVRCPLSVEPDAVLLAGNSGADRLVLRENVPATVAGILQGDKGSDVLIGGPGDDSLNGKWARGDVDVLNGGGGEDALASGTMLFGGAGSDLLIASPCAGEHVEGGPGVDSASFARAYLGLGVQVQLGGDAVLPAHTLSGARVPAGCSFNGPDPEPSSIGKTIENIEGSPKDDVLIGSDAANIVLGRAGDDTILGGRGNDFLVGGTGVDDLAGGLGHDRLYAHDGRRDGRIRCGSTGSRLDVARVDLADPLARGCRLLP